MDDRILFELAEDVILRESPSPEYRSSLTDEKYQQLVGMIQQRDQIIQHQSIELSNIKKTLDEHEHTIKVAKVRSVQCLSIFNKYKEVRMYQDQKNKLKLPELLNDVNRVRPEGVREIDRTELLEASRSLGFNWRKSDSDWVTDGWAIRKGSSTVLPNLQSVQIKSPVMSPQVSPVGSPAPVMIK